MPTLRLRRSQSGSSPRRLRGLARLAAAASGLCALQTFAAGLAGDGDAVGAALTRAWSNAQAEGQITKLKLIKRQTYGRAGFNLLRRRLLLAA